MTYIRRYGNISVPTATTLGDLTTCFAIFQQENPSHYPVRESYIRILCGDRTIYFELRTALFGHSETIIEIGWDRFPLALPKHGIASHTG